MKTQLTFPQEANGIRKPNKATHTSIRSPFHKRLHLFGILLMTLLISNTVFAQSDASAEQITVKGLVSDEDGPLPGVSITLKNVKVGTTTNTKGEFTFPRSLSVGDILVFSYLGYETQEIKIRKNTSFIKLMLTSDLIEILGAVNEDKPYKSKRKN